MPTTKLQPVDGINAELLAALDAIHAPIFIHDENYHLVHVNLAYLKQAGKPLKEVIGQPYFAIFPRHSGPLPQCCHATEQGGTAQDVVHLDNGNIFNSHSVSIRNRDGRHLQSLHILEDISQQRMHTAQQLRRALKVLSASHSLLFEFIDETQLLQQMCRIIVSDDGYCLAWVGYVEQDEENPIRKVAQDGHHISDVNTLYMTSAQADLGSEQSLLAIHVGQTQIARHLQHDASLPLHKEAQQHGYAASVALPLRNGAEVLGVLNIYAREPDAFDADEVLLLEEMAANLVFSILYFRTRDERDYALKLEKISSEQLLQGLEDALQAVASMMEMRDPYTAGHSRRVADLAKAIACEMGFSAARAHGIYLAGIVHDLGKIATPAEILCKPLRLNKHEFGLIMLHPQTGHDILKGIKFPWPIAQAVLQHHERLDGSGYPLGLKQNEISLEGCILAVADVVEAMSSHRPYRPGLGIAAALVEIGNKRGSQFCANSVDACLKLFKEGYQFPAR